MAGYVTARKEHPAYQRADGNTARQALAIERDLRALVHARLLALAPKPELIERVQNIAYVAGRLTTPEGALDLVVNRLVSRGITRALEAVPATVPLVVAVMVAKDVLGALNEISLSEREKREEIEDEHRHDREWQYVQVERHEYERER